MYFIIELFAEYKNQPFPFEFQLIRNDSILLQIYMVLSCGFVVLDHYLEENLRLSFCWQRIVNK